MREAFRQYYPPTDDELREMWESGSIVLDTNSLLNLYRYTSTTQESFLSVLEALRDRLWIPFQVAGEFQRRRLDVIDDQRTAYDRVREHLEAAKKDFAGTLSRYKRHASLDTATIDTEFQRGVDEILAALKAQEEAHGLRFSRGYPDDAMWERISDLFEGRVGAGFDKATLDAIYADGAARYAAETPPGYKDASKGEPDKYGDLVLWKEVLQRAKSRQDCAIFVTDDGKEDWWRIRHGERLGPRPELVAEYFDAAGKRIHFYSPEQFLRHAQTQSKVSVGEASLGEVALVSSQDRIRLAAEQRLKMLERERSFLETRSRRPRSRGPMQRETIARLSRTRRDLHEEIEKAEQRAAQISDHIVLSEKAPSREELEELALMRESVAGMRDRLRTVDRRLDSLDIEAAHSRDRATDDQSPELLHRLAGLDAEIAQLHGALEPDGEDH